MADDGNIYMSPTSVRSNNVKSDCQTVDEDDTYMTPQLKNSFNESGMVDMSEFCRSNTNKPEGIVFAPRPKSNVQVDPKTSPLLKPTHQSHLSLRKHFADLELSQKRDRLSPEEKNGDELYVEADDATTSPNFRGVQETDLKSPEKVSRKKSIVIVQGESEYNSFISLKEEERPSDEYQIPIRLESISEDSNSTVYLDLCTENDDTSKNQVHEGSSSSTENINMGGVMSRKKLGLLGKSNDVTRPGGTTTSVRMRSGRIKNGNLVVSGTGSPRPISMPFSSPPAPPGSDDSNMTNTSPPPPPQGSKPQIYNQNNQANPGNRPLPPTPGKNIGSGNNLNPEHQPAARVSSIPVDAPPLPPTLVPSYIAADKPPPLLPKSDKPYIPKLPYRPPSPFLKISEPESTSSSASSSPTRKFSANLEISPKPPILGPKPLNTSKIPLIKYPNSPTKTQGDTGKPSLKSNVQALPKQNSNAGSPSKVHPIAEMIKRKQMENESTKTTQSPAKSKQWPPVSPNQVKNDRTIISNNTSKNSTHFLPKNLEANSAKLPVEIGKSPRLPFKPPIGAKGLSFNLKPVPPKKEQNIIEPKLPEEMPQNPAKLQQPTKKRAPYSLHKLQAAKLSNTLTEETKPDPPEESEETENVADPNIYSSIECESAPELQNKPRGLPPSLLLNINAVQFRRPRNTTSQLNSVTLNRNIPENLPPNSPNKSSTLPRSPITKSRRRPNVPPPPRPTMDAPKPPIEIPKSPAAEKPSSSPIRSPPPSSPSIKATPHGSYSLRSPPPSRPPPPSMANIKAAKWRQETTRQDVEKRVMSSSLHVSKSKTTPVKYKPTLSQSKNKSLEVYINDGNSQEETYQAIPDVSSESNFSTCSEDSEQREGYSPRHQTKKKKKSLSSIVAFTTKKKRKAKQDEVFDESPTYMMAVDNHKTIPEPNHFEAIEECIYSGIDDNYNNSNNNSSIYLTSIPSKQTEHTEYTYAELDHALYDDVTY